MPSNTSLLSFPQDEKLTPQLVRPTPPNFGSDFVSEYGSELVLASAGCGVTSVAPPADESQRRQHEEWLAETQQLLQMQQRLLEDQIAAHRKTKKSLSAKQRTAKKAGRAFAEEDAAQLRHVTELQGTVQKQLEQVRPSNATPPSLLSSARHSASDVQQMRETFSFNWRCFVTSFHPA